jgi:hypothetical protein
MTAAMRRIADDRSLFFRLALLFRPASAFRSGSTLRLLGMELHRPRLVLVPRTRLEYQAELATIPANRNGIAGAVFRWPSGDMGLDPSNTASVLRFGRRNPLSFLSATGGFVSLSSACPMPNVLFGNLIYQVRKFTFFCD